MLKNIPQGSWIEVREAAFDFAQAQLSEVGTENVWEVGAQLLRDAIGDLSDGLRVFVKKKFRAAEASGYHDITYSEISDAIGDQPGDGLDICLEWINDFAGDLCSHLPAEGEPMLSFEHFLEECELEMDVRKLDMSDPDGEQSLTDEEQRETALATGVVEAVCLYLHYVEYSDAIEN